MKMIDLPPVWLAGFAALAWAQAAFLPVGAFGTFGDTLGGALVGLGVVLMLLAFVEFIRARTSVIPHQTPKAIITSGIFRLSRNPIYLGDALILVGLCLRWDAALSLFFVPVFVWLIDRRFIRAEEARLRAGFPDEFDDYAQRVRRWI